MTDTLSKKLSASKTIEKKVRAPSTPTSSKKALSENLVQEVEQPVEQSANPVVRLANPKLYDVEHPTGDKIRDKIRSLLCDAMYKKDEGTVESREEAQIIANAIEAAMFHKFDGNGQPYKQKYRNISFNLKDPKNGKLRTAVLLRELGPDELLEMSSDELANDELRQKREEIKEKMTRDAMPYNKREASTDMFKCGKCKERKCTYYQMQTRSADEPLTTFVQCVNCNNRWRF